MLLFKFHSLPAYMHKYYAELRPFDVVYVGCYLRHSFGFFWHYNNQCTM